MTFAFIYKLFQIHFPTNSLSHSLSHINIISSFIIYFFLTTTHHSTFFYSIVDYYNRKKSFEEWTVAHQTWWATVHEQKKIQGIESPLETIFLVSLYYREYFTFNYTIEDALSGRTLKCIYIPKGVLRNLCMDVHVDLVIFGNQNLLSIPLYVPQIKFCHLSINTYFFYLLFHLPKMR